MRPLVLDVLLKAPGAALRALFNSPKTHDYTERYWGHDYSIQEVRDDGRSLTAMGWGCGIEEGHFLLLRNGAGSTRYLVRRIRYMADPHDMWSASLEFAPRQGPSPETEDGAGR
ncbi:hypothetical protein [Myxococcus eversor]|uniref:hypothetical protein n=1 Tax=Myxococcus eversor TaxID=2709661 RepID=UPI0013D3A87E|nr:hypothetical protein [Myxococcus eversor]